MCFVSCSPNAAPLPEVQGQEENPPPQASSCRLVSFLPERPLQSKLRPCRSGFCSDLSQPTSAQC
jgi:hypothetical protein